MWMMLQRENPDDFVIATGEAHSVREFLDEVFGLLDLDWRKHVRTDPYYLRAAEVDYLMGDPSKAAKALGWKPSISFRELARLMTEHDLELAHREAHAASFRQAGSL